MENGQESRIRYVLGIILSNAFAIVQFIVSIGFLSSVAALVMSFHLTTLEIVLVSILAFWMVILAFRFSWRRISYRAYHYPNSRIHPNYVILYKELNYCVENGVLNYSRKLEVKSLVNNLSSITDKYLWTGATRLTNQIQPVSGISKIEHNETIGIWTYFTVNFAAKLERGKTCIIEYKWPVINDYKSSQPFVSTSTEMPTKRLSFKIRLGLEFANKQFILEEYQTIDAVEPLRVVQGQFDSNGYYELVPDRPKRFRHYRVIWNWQPGGQILTISDVENVTPLRMI